MPRKPAPKPDNPEQSKRFVEMAQELRADQDAEGLERALKKIASKRPTGNNPRDR